MIMTKNASKTFCEFFAGIGLVHKALTPSWTCMYANDIDSKKEQMYKDEFGATDYFHLGDVWDTNSVLDHIKGRPFLATASFPCTDLSLAGNNHGFEGKESSTLFGFLKVINALGVRKPRLVLLENVTGFLTSHGGKDFEKAVKALAQEGYWIDALVLDAKYFVPQSRPRVFVIGINKNIKSDLVVRRSKHDMVNGKWLTTVCSSGPLRPSRLIKLMERIDLPTGWATVPLPQPPASKYSLLKIIDTDEKQDWWNSELLNKHYEMMSPLHKKHVDMLIKDNVLHVGTGFRRIRNGQMRNEVRFDGLTGCLRTPRGGSAKQIVVVAGKGTLRMRWMSPVEYARLQGADDFNIKVGVQQALFGFGDAVCVPVIKWLDRNILTPIYDSANNCSRQFSGDCIPWTVSHQKCDQRLCGR